MLRRSAIDCLLRKRAALRSQASARSGKTNSWRSAEVVFVLLLCSLWLAGCGLAGGGSQTPSTTSSSTSTTTSPQISVVPATVAFGNVAVANTNTQTVTVTNPGNADLTLSQANISGSGFSITGLTLPVTIASGKNTSFDIAFSPPSASNFSGNLSLVSNAPNSPTVIAISGSGVTATSHSVTLNWTASASTVSGYNIYRGSQTSGPYTLLNSSLINGTTFTDGTVQAGLTYYYVTTAVDSSDVESAYSNEVSATIPSP